MIRLTQDYAAISEFCAADIVGRLQLAQYAQQIHAGHITSGAVVGFTRAEQPERVIGVCWYGQSLVLATSSPGEQSLLQRVIGYAESFGVLDRLRSVSTDPESMSQFLTLTDQRWSARLRLHQRLYQLVRPQYMRYRSEPENHRRMIKKIKPALRFSTSGDYVALVQACRHMVQEEHGYDPLPEQTSGDSEQSRKDAFARYVRRLVEYRKMLCVMDGYGEVMYKAELGIMHSGIVQLEGVWLAPRYRGQGLARSFILQTLDRIFELGAYGVCLYVNENNAPAVKTYENVGFTRVGTRDTALR